MRKLISWVSAVSMIATSFTVVMTAQAADETVLYSDSFNGYETSHKTETGTVFAAIAGGDYESVRSNPEWQWIFNSPASQTLDKLTVGFDGSRGDDGGAIMINEKESAADKYLSLTKNRQQSRQKPQVTGFDSYKANDGEDLVIAFDLMLKDTELALASNAVAEIEFLSGTTSLGTIDTTKAESGKWVKVKAVTSDGLTDIYVDNEEVISDAEGAISTIRPKPFDTDTKLGDNGLAADYPTINIDELVIMSAADGAAAEVPKAEDKTPVDPEDTTPTPPVDYETAVKYDFDNEEAPIEIGTSFSSEVVDGSAIVDGTNSTKVLSVTGSSDSSKPGRFGYAYIDISEYTEGKSNIKVEYDAYINSGGRMVYSVAGDLPEEYSAGGLFRQGYAGDSPTNCVAATWIHTTVEVDLITGKGTYKVTNGDTSIASGSTAQSNELKYIVFLSWSPNTSYIDNIVVSTAGEREIATPKPTASPEPEATVAGSNLELAALGVESTKENFDASAIQNTATEVLNHSEAKPLVAGKPSVYSADNARGNSVYALYDVYVNKDDVIKITANNIGSSTSVGPDFGFTGNADGTVTATAHGDKGDPVSVSGNLVCGTWYRVLIEVPQINNGGSTITGTSVYTVYRINPEDTTKVTEVAAQSKSIGPRNLNNKGVTELAVEVTGTPYVDNVYLFIAGQGLDLAGGEVEPSQPPVTASPEPAGTAEGSNLTLAPESARDTKDFAEVEGAATKILNHSEAKPAVAGNVNAYSENAKGNAVYAVYDVLVNVGDVLNIAAYGNSNALGTTFILTGNADGTATASALVDKDDKEGSTVTLNGNLVCGTWYRVKIELPQNKSGEKDTSTGNARYTIYRIDPNDPTKTAGIAAEATGLKPRNLAEKGVTQFTVSVTGTPYIDNGVTYIDTTSENTWYRYHYTENDGIKTVTLIEKVSDPSKNGPEEGKSYVWNALMQPYVAPVAE